MGSDHFKHCLTCLNVKSMTLVDFGCVPQSFLKSEQLPPFGQKARYSWKKHACVIYLLITKSHWTKKWPGLQCIWPSPDIATCIYSWDSPFVALPQTDKSQAKERTCSKYCFGAPSLLVLVSKFMDFSIFFLAK